MMKRRINLQPHLKGLELVIWSATSFPKELTESLSKGNSRFYSSMLPIRKIKYVVLAEFKKNDPGNVE